DCMRALRATTGIQYDQSTRGILEFHFDPKSFADAAKAAELIGEYGGDRGAKTAPECAAIEPGLAACRGRLAGGIFTAGDESGDAHRFTQELARLAAERGVAFRWGTTVESLVTDGISVRGARCFTPVDTQHRGHESIDTDVYVIALGAISPLL